MPFSQMEYLYIYAGSLQNLQNFSSVQSSNTVNDMHRLSFSSSDDMDEWSLDSTTSDFPPKTIMNNNAGKISGNFDKVAKGSKCMAFEDAEDITSDLRQILTIPELCDVTFLVGKDETPVYGIKAIMAIRSSVFHEMILSYQTPATHEVNQRKKGSAIKSRFQTLKEKCASPRKTPKKVVLTPPGRLIIPIGEFDPDVFRRVILYLHTGSVRVDFRSVIGVMNAADTYGLGNLRAACYDFAKQFINLNSVLPLLVSTQSFANYKWTKLLMPEILEFIASRAQDILRMSSFKHLPSQVAALILQTRGLEATVETKLEAALQWSRQQCCPLDINLFQESKNSSPDINSNGIQCKVNREAKYIPPPVVPTNIKSRTVTHKSYRQDISSLRRESVRMSTFRTQAKVMGKPPISRTVSKTYSHESFSETSSLASSRPCSPLSDGSSDSGIGVYF